MNFILNGQSFRLLISKMKSGFMVRYSSLKEKLASFKEDFLLKSIPITKFIKYSKCHSCKIRFSHAPKCVYITSVPRTFAIIFPNFAWRQSFEIRINWIWLHYYYGFGFILNRMYKWTNLRKRNHTKHSLK